MCDFLLLDLLTSCLTLFSSYCTEVFLLNALVLHNLYECHHK